MEELEVSREEAELEVKKIIRTKEFTELMTFYKCAIMEVETKLNVLNQEFSLQYDRNPFESIETRLKDPVSAVEKLMSRGIEVSLENFERELFDVAGIRVVCSFKEDIYKLADLLVEQDDVLLLMRKDYIKRPKDNGYRSLHMIVDIPIFLSNGKKHMKVEVQFRTIAMDFWASVEHKLKYKKEIQNPEAVGKRLKRCADILANMDDEMEDIRRRIDSEFVDETDGGDGFPEV